MAAMASENYQLKWHSFGAHLHTSVATSLNSDAFTDVSLFTTDGHQITAHRFVLAACSQYLHQIFKIQTKSPTNLPIVVIMPPEISYKTLKTLIQYMYCGETTVSNDILESVLRGGDILQIRGLWRPRTETPQPPKDAGAPSLLTPVKVIQKTVLKTVDSNVKTNENVQKPAKSHDKAKEKEDAPPKDTHPSTHSTHSTHSAHSTHSSNGSEKDENEDAVDGADKDDQKPDADKDDKNKSDVNYIVIKEEPMEWNEFQEVDIAENEMFHSEMTIKPEIIFPTEDNDYQENGELYSPLTCELCSETFTLPAEWVRHIRTHSDTQPAKRQRRGKSFVDDEPFPPLQCDLCQKLFATPGEWVRHIQNTHTENELASANNSNSQKIRINRPIGITQKVCTICNKKFPSHASMLIHRRTHTGERPFICEFCQKGFNVKSNLLRHLRTLHGKIINSSDVIPDGKE